MSKSPDTSWESAANWYDEYLRGPDTYQEKVILPNLLRLLDLKSGERVLDLACGQGYFTSHLLAAGAQVTGVDASTSLIAKAREHVPAATLYIADAAKLPLASASVDAVVCVLALQNMEQLLPVFKEVKRVLRTAGRFIFIINHPAFRVPKRSDWGWDEAKQVQYRRVERYLSGEKVKIELHPGKATDTSYTWSFHRSLQDFAKALNGAGLVISKLEEWISHKQSQTGLRGAAEDAARKEIPMFLAISCIKLQNIAE
jgi:ubiquinone/menaquinone biosynthesis C-methylase UbiE